MKSPQGRGGLTSAPDKWDLWLSDMTQKNFSMRQSDLFRKVGIHSRGMQAISASLVWGVNIYRGVVVRACATGGVRALHLPTSCYFVVRDMGQGYGLGGSRRLALYFKSSQVFPTF